MSTSSGPKFHPSNHGYLQHWRRIGPLLESIRRAELRRQGTKPNDWRVVDSLLQLGYLHRDPNRLPTCLIEGKRRLVAAYAKRDAESIGREAP